MRRGVPRVGVWYLPLVHYVPFRRKDDPCFVWLTGPGVRWEMPARFDPLAEHGELPFFNDLPSCQRAPLLPQIRGALSCPFHESPHDGFQHCVEEPYVRASPIPRRLVYHQVVVVSLRFASLLRCRFRSGGTPCKTSKPLHPSSVTRIVQ